MKQPINKLIPILAITSMAVIAGNAGIVFFDDFSEAPGTLIVGKSSDIGLNWTGSGGAVVSAGNTLDTTGDGRFLYGKFTSSLGAGQILTLSYNSFSLPNFFGGGWSGVSLYEGGNERVFTGHPNGATSWGVDGALAGYGVSGESTGTTTATFTYQFDTGGWTFTTLSGVSLSGVGAAGYAFNELRVANGSGADIHVDNLSVDISAVPEPTSLALAGLGVATLLTFYRRQS
ncbi:MAG: PEP-CTERM sorting domain-containing protein [Verrucomicrobiota bacterium]